MGALTRRSSALVVAAFCLGAVLLVHFAGGAPVERTLVFSVLLVAVVLASSASVEDAATTDRSLMPPSFVLVFTSLLLFGPHLAALVGVAAALTPRLRPAARTYPPLQTLIEVALLLASIEAAGLAHQWLGGTSGSFAWPWQGVPIAAALIAYQLTRSTLSEIVVPFVARTPIDRSWPVRMLRSMPVYVVGAGIAVCLAAVIDLQLWAVVPVVAVPLFFACWTYADYVTRIEDERRGRDVAAFREEGLCGVGRDGRVTVWNDVIERMLGCARDRALGRDIVGAVPALGATELPRAIRDTLSDRTPRTLPQVRIASATDPRTLLVKVVPVAEGVSLLWHDVTDRVRAEQESRRTVDRYALAVEGANDGLWDWDLRTREFHASGRWWQMVGMPASSGTVRPEIWFERVHPEDLADLQRALESHLTGVSELLQHEHRIRREDGTYRRFLCRGVALKGAGRRPDRIAGSLTDTTEHTIAQERLRSAGFLDSLTGLCNRDVFVEGLGRRLEDGRVRRVSSSFAVLYVDIDRFKIVNDSLGHLVGDELLVGISRRLESCLRAGDSLARLGGDEFAILLSGLAEDGQANAIAFRIQESLTEPFSIGGREVFTSASIGIAFGPAHYTNPDEVMRDADTAMYHAKSRGKARHEVFDAAMHARVRDRLSLENDLRRAVSTFDFEVVYQPIVALTSGMCIGFESLIRWTRDGEPISPVTFIPIAEELGLIEQIGTWVMQRACQTFADWQRRFPGAGLECITVNVSSRQLMQHNFLRIVQQAVQDSGLARADLRVEITETALMDSPADAASLLRDLRNYGVKVYLDDFGTGYSSLSHLHKLPVDALKIDRSFVKSLLLPDRPAIVESILALARTLKTSVVAEGIETDAQARELERLGCTHAQGFLFARPLSASAVEAMLVANVPLGPKGATAIAPPLEDWAETLVLPQQIPAQHAVVPRATPGGMKPAAATTGLRSAVS